MSSSLKATKENKASKRNGVKRMLFAVVGIALEVALDLIIVLFLNEYSVWITIVLHILSALLVLVIYNQNKTSAMKIPWIILIMAFPILGLTMYLMVGLNPGLTSMRERYMKVDSMLYPFILDPEHANERAKLEAADNPRVRHRPAKDDDDKDIAELMEDHSDRMDSLSNSAKYSLLGLGQENVKFPENDAARHLREIDPGAANIAKYLNDTADYPPYEDVPIVYYDDAADGIEAQKKMLKKAQKFIFMEYHAIENAESWQAIQEVLEDRVKAGVEVRVFYDDMGSLGFIDTDFVKQLRDKGIKCRVFNPFKLGLNLFLNNRDHRKITVIDGVVGFTGGYNIANEYFHITEPFGYWKDTGIMFYGPAVRSLTMMFLESWNAMESKDQDYDTDFGKYLPDLTEYDLKQFEEAKRDEAAAEAEAVKAEAVGADTAADTGVAEVSAVAADAAENTVEVAAAETAASTPDIADAAEDAGTAKVYNGKCGFVIPYGDMPLDNEHVGEDVYISVAEYAKDYAWYITPYLILTDEMTHALGLAAKRGVDVRVITPGIPDKPLIYSVTRSYYQGLVRNGVRVFEYTPGFCHAKMSVADDKIATCGTINLDYRSLYHHFENGCMYTHCKAVLDTKADFEHMFEECREVTDDYKSPTAGRAFGQMLLRLIAPLL